MTEFVQIYRNLKNALQSPPGKNFKICDFSNLRYPGEYERFFHFVMQSKTDMFKGLIREPFYFYFIDTDVIDAYAYKQPNGCNVIGVSRGLFSTLISTCESCKPQLERIIPRRKINMEIFNGSTIDQFMFFVARYFIHYHELAHIIQYTNRNELKFESYEQLQEGPYIVREHVKERDADILGAVFAANHILDRWTRLPVELKTVETLEMMLSFGIVGIYLLFDILSSGFKRTLYLYKTDHPHAYVRIRKIIEVMAEKAGQDSNLPTNHMRIIQNVLSLLRELNMDASANKFIETMAVNEAQIELYEKTMRLESSHYRWLATPMFTHRRSYRKRMKRNKF